MIGRRLSTCDSLSIQVPYQPVMSMILETIHNNLFIRKTLSERIGFWKHVSFLTSFTVASSIVDASLFRTAVSPMISTWSPIAPDSPIFTKASVLPHLIPPNYPLPLLMVASQSNTQTNICLQEQNPEKISVPREKECIVKSCATGSLTVAWDLPGGCGQWGDKIKAVSLQAPPLLGILWRCYFHRLHLLFSALWCHALHWRGWEHSFV